MRLGNTFLMSFFLTLFIACNSGTGEEQYIHLDGYSQHDLNVKSVIEGHALFKAEIENTVLEPLLLDFGTTKTGTDWQIVNDGIMGGQSYGRISLKENSLYFDGSVSLENNGGFTMVVSPFGEFDLSKYDSVELKYKSEFQYVTLYLETPRIYNFFVRNMRPSEGWQTLNLGLEEFKLSLVGRQTNRILNSTYKKDIERIGFLTNRKASGAFSFEVDYIKFY